MMIALIVILVIASIVLYFASAYYCSRYFGEKDVDFNIITLLIAFTPIINFIISLKAVDWKQLKLIFKDQNSDE